MRHITAYNTATIINHNARVHKQERCNIHFDIASDGVVSICIYPESGHKTIKFDNVTVQHLAETFSKIANQQTDDRINKALKEDGKALPEFKETTCFKCDRTIYYTAGETVVSCSDCQSLNTIC